MYQVPETIESEQLVLRKFEPGDLDVFSRFMTDAESTRFLAFASEMKTPAGAAMLLRTTLESYDSDSPLFALAATDREAQRFLGMCGLNLLNQNEVEIFYTVVRQLWGQGIGFAIASTLSRYALLELGVAQLIAFIVPGHIASEKVACKVGFQRTGLVDNPNFSDKVFRYTLSRETLRAV